MSKLDFVDRIDHARKRDQFKERLARVLIKRGIELVFVRWVDPAWLITINYKGSNYTLRAKIEKRTPFAVSTIMHLKNRVVFWKDIVDEREANHGAVWR